MRGLAKSAMVGKSVRGFGYDPCVSKSNNGMGVIMMSASALGQAHLRHRITPSATGRKSLLATGRNRKLSVWWVFAFAIAAALFGGASPASAQTTSHSVPVAFNTITAPGETH